MNTIWFRGCKTEEEKESIRQRLLTNNDLFDRLRAMLKSDMEANLKSQEQVDNFARITDIASQSMHLAAERKTIRKVLGILEFERKHNNG